MDQIPADQRPKVFVRCLAQAIDPDDFVHVWGMAKWMGLYEKMVCEFATVLATNEEMVAHMKLQAGKHLSTMYPGLHLANKKCKNV